jgi:hypothetical protein
MTMASSPQVRLLFVEEVWTMATVEERARLLAVACPWCEAPPGAECRVRGTARQNRRRGQKGPSVLDGRCHDARWQAALGRPAKVLVDRLPPRRGTDEGRVAVLDRPEPGVEERPW